MSTTTPSATITEIGAWPIDGLAPLEGRILTVQLPPGAAAPVHRHPGAQFVWVAAGSVTSRLAGDEQPRRFGTGEGWYERPGRVHELFTNVGDEPATVVVFDLAVAGAPVLVVEP